LNPIHPRSRGSGLIVEPVQVKKPVHQVKSQLFA
jgi:hypothetical protein